MLLGRAPHGARGLKRWLLESMQDLFLSRPAWGAWIETFPVLRQKTRKTGRAPHGARGLKLSVRCTVLKETVSRPAWGAWIET